MIPSSIPLLVKPCSAKLDIEALTAALPKYLCLEEMHKKWWLSFLEELNGTCSFNAESIEEEETLGLLDIVCMVKEHKTLTLPESSLLLSKLIEHHKHTINDIPDVSQSKYLK